MTTEREKIYFCKYRKEHPDQRRESAQKYKKLHINTLRKKERIYYKINAEKIQKHKREYYKTHAEKMCDYRRKYRKLHLDKVKEYSRKHNKIHADKRHEYARKYRNENSDKIHKHRHEYNKKNSKKLCELSLKWARNHPDLVRARNQKRRARLTNSSGWNYTTSQHIKWRWEMWGNKCYVCGNKATATDHVIPLSRGGTHFPANMRPICHHCNSVKYIKRLQVFLDFIKS